MTTGTKPLLRGSTYAGALLAAFAAGLSVLPLAFALVPGLAWRTGPEPARWVLTLLVWAALTAAGGALPGVRRLLAGAARRLLRVPVPPPVPNARVRQGRWRTPLWLLLLVVLGWVVILLGGLLLLTAVALPWAGLGGTAEIDLYGWSPEPAFWWTWPAALLCLLLTGLLCAAVTGTLGQAAPLLLGPSAAERLAAAAERERALAERNRLAQELHDSIGHTLTATTIQAAVAGEVLEADPNAARAAMRSIEESARAALEDLDHVLGVLREEQPGADPARTLADLPELLERLRHAGVEVRPELSGDLSQLPGILSRAAYRIVQEGLTNALRHGTGGPVGLRVTARDGELELQVVNPTGPGPAAFPPYGRGLRGLTERVGLLHGELTAGPDGPQRWRLTVSLPTRVRA
ncbi:sensor histidine kinase [Kitasatospora sp. NPDC096147]|uniref:sensor histidine kinase n=1 Tax=Kitasatospora sp. NPDC096147 TaxID=3364093 RepID=UPI0037FA1718